PFEDDYFDAVSSLSVLEHQLNKALAVSESARVLKPLGLFTASFDVCESLWEMTYPSRLGRGLSVRECEEIVWNNPIFDCSSSSLEWTRDQCRRFMEWHWDGRPDSRYVVAAAALRKANH